MADGRFDVVVIGSCFVDMISYVPHFPKFDETVKGTKFQLDFGGKAANQCVMAQKLGANTAMVAKIGNDQFGEDTIQNFKKFGVNTDFISVTDKAETGITSIAVNSSGEPAFISLAGANRHLTIEDITAAETVIRSCPVMVCDKGIPLKIAAAALQYGKKLGSRTLFNPSPKLESIPQAVYTNTDVLVLNREEGESLTEISANDFEGTKGVIVKLHQQGASHVVLTLGSQGAIASVLTSENKTPVMTHIRTSKVDVVDTTGAGDALTGALAFYMSCYPQLSLAEMVSRAVNIATITVTVHGVQSSYPTREEIDDWLFDIDAQTSEQLCLEMLSAESTS
ncbi:hypothetical protein ACROYT_G022554 [Oculina patagonica]